MKIFLDTAKLDELKAGFSTGIVDRTTTNPSLMKKAIEASGDDTDIESYINKILEIAGKLPVSLEVKGGSADDMISQGKALYKRFSNSNNHVVIKIPLNPSTDDTNPTSFEGLKAIKALSDEGIPINVTLIFTPEQALLAAKAGAAYVSPFVGRIDDKIRKDNNMEFEKTDYFPAEGIEKEGKEGKDSTILAEEESGLESGIELVEEIRVILDNYDMNSEIIAASIRNSRQAREAALAGADIATLPPQVFNQMTAHNKTREGMRNFLKDTIPEYEKLM